MKHNVKGLRFLSTPRTFGSWCLKMKKAAILVGLVLLVLPMISAFANTFLEDKTMHLWKGETGEYCIYLQNTGEKELIQAIKIFEGKEYIKNMEEIDKEFNVPVGTISDNLPVCMNLKLLRSSEKGGKYPISYGVASVSSDNKKGLVSLAPIQIRETFYLTERLDKKPFSPTAYIVVFLILIGISILSVMGYKIRKRRKVKLLES